MGDDDALEILETGISKLNGEFVVILCDCYRIFALAFRLKTWKLMVNVGGNWFFFPVKILSNRKPC